MHLYEENVEKSFSQNVLKTNGWNLQWVIKVVRYFSYNQNFVICLCPWAIYICKVYQISHGAFWQKGIANLFKWYYANLQAGLHVHIW